MISVIVPVFRNAANALELVQALLRQELPPDSPLEIIVVDDGSGDGNADLLRQHVGGHVHLIELPHNMGRSVARNSGAEQAQGQYLVFIDCDCRPMGANFLANHLSLLRGGSIASCGPVTGQGHGFWSRYQSDASARRARQHAESAVFSGSSQNFSVRASSFHLSGGFDPRYTEYGFEDRDLLIRLSRLGSVSWCVKAMVSHLDPLTLAGVMEKMQAAAGDSSARFSHDHAEAYRTLGYAALDTRLRPWLRPFTSLLKPLLQTAPTIDRFLDSPWLPYFAAKSFVKVLVALAYMHGTLAHHGKT